VDIAMKSTGEMERLKLQLRAVWASTNVHLGALPIHVDPYSSVFVAGTRRRHRFLPITCIATHLTFGMAFSCVIGCFHIVFSASFISEYHTFAFRAKISVAMDSRFTHMFLAYLGTRMRRHAILANESFPVCGTLNFPVSVTEKASLRQCTLHEVPPLADAPAHFTPIVFRALGVVVTTMLMVFPRSAGGPAPIFALTDLATIFIFFKAMGTKHLAHF